MIWRILALEICLNLVVQSAKYFPQETVTRISARKKETHLNRRQMPASQPLQTNTERRAYAIGNDVAVKKANEIPSKTYLVEIANY